MNKHTESLGKESIGKLLFRQSLPAMIGMLVMSLYNLVDTIFVGRGVGTLGIGGIAVSFPIMMILLSIGIMIGIGMASIISRALGSKDYSKAEKTLGNFFTLTIGISIVMTLLGVVFLVPLLKLFGATPDILPFAVEYMSIIFYGTIFVSFAAASNNIIRAEGNAKYAMMVMIISSVINMILDPIFIFGFGWGIAGAAIATVIAYFSSAMAALYYFVFKKSTIKIHLKNFKLDMKILKETFAIGASSFARTVSMSLSVIILNNTLAYYGGSIAIAAFGIINRLIMFTVMPIIGIVQGLQPILGYNYGAKDYGRARLSISLAMKSATVLSTFAFILLFLFATPVMTIFSTDSALLLLASKATRILILMFPIIGFQFIAGGIYQSMGKAKPAFLISLLRQLIVLVPIVLILPIFYGLDGIWYSFPIADLIAGIITFIMVKKEFRILRKNNVAA